MLPGAMRMSEVHRRIQAVCDDFMVNEFESFFVLRDFFTKILQNLPFSGYALGAQNVDTLAQYNPTSE